MAADAAKGTKREETRILIEFGVRNLGFGIWKDVPNVLMGKVKS